MSDPAGQAGGLSNLAFRLLTAAVLVPVILLLVAWQNHLGFWVFVLLATMAGLYEFLDMSAGDADRVDRTVVLVVGTGFAVALYWWPAYALQLLGGAITLTMIYAVFRFRNMETIGRRLALWITAIAYCGLLFTAFALLKRLDPSGDWVILAMTVSWFGDTGAYFTGRAIGGPKIYPAVTPKKTWAGSLGGLCSSVGAGVLARLWYMPQLSWLDVFLICVPAAVLGQVGDFAESVLKRSFGVKDSGKMLPGHGGMLDRVDALMFVSAYLYVYLTLIFGRI